MALWADFRTLASSCVAPINSNTHTLVHCCIESTTKNINMLSENRHICKNHRICMITPGMYFWPFASTGRVVKTMCATLCRKLRTPTAITV